MNKGVAKSNTKEVVTYKKNFSNGNSLLKDDGGDITGSNGEEIRIIVPNKNELIVESNLKDRFERTTINFHSNLACADLIGIDKAENLFSSY